MGFIVKKKLAKAVQRNRIKRLMKEAYRYHQSILTEAVSSQGICFHGAFMAATPELSWQQAEENITNLLLEVRNQILPTPDS